MKRSLPARPCIFCGSRENISQEHVVPNWLRKVIPRVDESHGFTGFSIRRLPDAKSIIYQPGIAFAEGNIANRRVYMVCQRCNNGWMSRLQNELKPILTPLILGTGQTSKACDSIALRSGLL